MILDVGVSEKRGDKEKEITLVFSNREKFSSALKILFLSSDTGGGHRASAESLARQFELLYPGTKYELLDIMEKNAVHPYNKLVSSYRHFSAHPRQWAFLYNISNSRAFELFFDVHNNLTCENAIRKSIMTCDPDVVISVHPMMTNIPVMSCAKINKQTRRHLPIFTVVTDLGSAHCLWFARGVDKMFVATDQIRELAKVRGKINHEKIVKIGLPIRHQFSIQSDLLGDRMSDEGIKYQRKIRKSLELPSNNSKIILLMGGGEGVGLISNIVNSLYVEHVNQGIDAVILVICGRNEKLKNDIAKRDWNEILEKKKSNYFRSRSFSKISLSSCVNWPSRVASVSLMSSSKFNLNDDDGCIDCYVTRNIRRVLNSSISSNENIIHELKSNSHSYSRTKSVKRIANIKIPSSSFKDIGDKLLIESNRDIHSYFPLNLEKNISVKQKISLLCNEKCDIQSNAKSFSISGKVSVVSVGFVANIADYMVAADVLVSKAGPGTIAEAASLSLPVLLTSFLPGQEEGNVNFVVYGGFGSFVSDSDPVGIAEKVAYWLSDHSKLKKLSEAAKLHGVPSAARNIVKYIGDLTMKWRQINDASNILENESEFPRNNRL